MHRVPSHPLPLGALDSAFTPAEHPAAEYLSPSTASIFHIELDANERSRQRLAARPPALSPLPPPPRPPSAPTSLLFKRSISDLGDYTSSRAEIAGLRSSGAVQRLLEAYKPTSTLEQQLRSHLRQLLPGPSPSATRPTLNQLLAALIDLGFLVQPHCGGGSSSEDPDPKRPAPTGMHRLQHHSLVCTGAQPPLSAVPVLLAEPLVIDPSFREQFTVQFGGSSVPTSYECLLRAVPSTFVGTLSRLEAVVTLLAREVSATFKQLQRPLPPWRKKASIMSRWAPDLLRDLAKAAAAAAAGQQQQQQQQQQQDDSQHGTPRSGRSSQDSSSSGPRSATSSEGLLEYEEGGESKAVSGGAEGKLGYGSGGSAGLRDEQQGYGALHGAGTRGAGRCSLVIQRIQSWNLPGRGRRQESALAAALRGSAGGAGGRVAVPDRTMSNPLVGAAPCAAVDAAAGSAAAAAAAGAGHSLHERLAFRFHTVKLGAKRTAK